MSWKIVLLSLLGAGLLFFFIFKMIKLNPLVTISVIVVAMSFAFFIWLILTLFGDELR